MVGAKKVTSAQNESQNAPNEVKATAPKVFPVRNSPHPGQDLGDPTVGERQSQHHRLSSAIYQIGVEHTEDKGGEGKGPEPQRPWVGRFPTRTDLGGADHLMTIFPVDRLPGANRCRLHGISFPSRPSRVRRRGGSWLAAIQVPTPTEIMPTGLAAQIARINE